MKIALFVETYLTYINGVKTHVDGLKNALEKLGHEVLVVCALPNVKKHVLKDGVLCCPSMSWKRIYNYGVAKPISPTRFKFIKEFNPDIIHIHTEFGIGISGASAARLLKIPYVYTLHTMYDEYLYYIAPKKFIKILKKIAHFYVKQLAKRASALIGPSLKIKDYLSRCGVNKEVEIIPNSVELNLFDENSVSLEEKQKIRDRLGLKREDFLGCFCSRLGKEKNLDLLLKNWSELIKKDKNIKLLIFGDGPYKKEFEELAFSLKILDNVIFLGKIDHEELPPYYAMCDFYVTTSLSDIYSISLLEAMASGLFVFHIYDELNKGQVENGVNGYIFKDVDEMIDLILEFKNLSSEQRFKFRKSARNSVLKLGEKSLGEKVLAVYEKAFERYNKKKKERVLV